MHMWLHQTGYVTSELQKKKDYIWVLSEKKVDRKSI